MHTVFFRTSSLDNTSSVLNSLRFRISASGSQNSLIKLTSTCCCWKMFIISSKRVKVWNSRESTPAHLRALPLVPGSHQSWQIRSEYEESIDQWDDCMQVTGSVLTNQTSEDRMCVTWSVISVLTNQRSVFTSPGLSPALCLSSAPQRMRSGWHWSPCHLFLGYPEDQFLYYTRINDISKLRLFLYWQQVKLGFLKMIHLDINTHTDGGLSLVWKIKFWIVIRDADWVALGADADQ